MLIGMRGALLLLFSLVTSFGNTLSTGTFGRDFYIGILKTYFDPLPQFSLLITSNTSGTATIYMPYLGVNTTRSFNQSLEYKVTGDTITKVNTTVEHKGIHVTTDVDVTLVVIKYPSDTWEGFLALPATMLSTRYVISSYESYRRSYLSDFLIVSVHDNTDVEIHVNGSINSVAMNHLDTYLFRRFKDLSGIIVNSSKPVAVFSGNDAAETPKTCTSHNGEYLVEQILPIKHFSHDFIVPPTPPKSGFMVRVYSSVENTSVTYRNAAKSKTIILSEAGDYCEIIGDSDPMYVAADKPAQVVLYAMCNNYNNDNVGDTFMSIVPSITQFANSYHFTVFSSSDNFDHYLVIISKTEHIAGIRINGQMLRNLFHTYSVSHVNTKFTVNVYKMTVGVYHLKHVYGKTFGAMQYGFTSYWSYGYILGMDGFIGCGPLNAPVNGVVDLTSDTVAGNQAVYSCKLGYALHGERMRTCQSDGFWNGSQPSCRLLDCGKPVTPRNGKVSTDDGTTYLSTAMFSCNIGFEIRGSNISVCQANGTWSSPFPTCVIRDCGNLIAPVYGHVDVSNGTTFGSQAIYSCTSGYTLRGEQKRDCLADGYWNGSQVYCQPLDCGNLNAPVNGHLDVSNGTTYGSQAIYSCTSGYTLHGEQKRTCLADGYWNGSPPNCQTLDCGNLNTPANGHVDISNGTTFGSQAIYSCTSGYTLQGGQKRECLADGYWSGSQPNCQSLGGGLTCLDCKDMSHLYLCDTVTTCSGGQVCYVETFTTNGGQLKYNSGCVDSQQCSSLMRQIGRRSSECVHCCSSQLCNVNGCGGQGIPSPDLRGPLCYECSYVSNMTECKTVKLCAQDEVCSIEKYDWGGVYDHYTTKCHSKQCLSHKRSFNEYVSLARTSRSTPVCQNCCSSDLCNTNCNVTSQSGTGVAIVG